MEINACFYFNNIDLNVAVFAFQDVHLSYAFF